MKQRPETGDRRPQDSYEVFYEQGSEIPEPAGGGCLFDSVGLCLQESTEPGCTWDT